MKLGIKQKNESILGEPEKKMISEQCAWYWNSQMNKRKLEFLNVSSIKTTFSLLKRVGKRIIIYQEWTDPLLNFCPFYNLQFACR